MKKKILGILVCLTMLMPALSMTAIANEPPSAPDIDGPTSGKPGTSYDYGLCSEDPEQDEITYCVEFGDGSGEVCAGPFPSGTCATVSHTWSSQGTYTITVTAKDSNGAESDPSTLSVTMPRNRLIQFNFVMQFLQNFPILRYILGL